MELILGFSSSLPVTPFPHLHTGLFLCVPPSQSPQVLAPLAGCSPSPIKSVVPEVSIPGGYSSSCLTSDTQRLPPTMLALSSSPELLQKGEYLCSYLHEFHYIVALDNVCMSQIKGIGCNLSLPRCPPFQGKRAL